MRASQPALNTLADVIDRHLAARDGADGIADVRGALATFRAGCDDRALADNNAPPACRQLDEALALVRAQSGDTIADAIAAAMPYLTWITYDRYPEEEIGPLFPTQHAFASLAALYDPAWERDFDLGLFLIESRTLYRDHKHQAAELYLPLTGPTRWRFGPDSTWSIRQAGEPVWNPPYQIHATLVEEAPLLCLYAWTRDIHPPAEVVPAADWPGIEAALMRP
jgi:hypothetical protein